jgi:hypothetical protein
MSGILLLFVMSLPSVVVGLDDWAELTAGCGGGTTAPNLTATMQVTSELTATWVGWVVDRTTIGGYFPSAYYETAHITCGTGAAVRGNLVHAGGRIGIVPCAGQCWLPILLLADLPAELEPFIDTIAVVELRGALGDNFEGPYLGSITGWSIPSGCGTVATEPVSWGAVKATYR